MRLVRRGRWRFRARRSASRRELTLRALPLQLTVPSSVTSSVSLAPGIEPLRVDEEQVLDGGAAAGERQQPQRSGRRARGAERLTPAPPRRRGAGRRRPTARPSPASRSTAWTPPKNRFAPRKRAISRPAASSASTVDARARRRRRRPRSAARGASHRRRRARRPWSTHADDRLQDRRADPVASRRCRARARRRRRAARPSAPSWTASAGRAGWRWKPSGLRSSSPMHVVEVDAGAGHDDPRALAVRAGHAARAARPRR